MGINFHENQVSRISRFLADFTKISSCKNLDYLKRLNQGNQSEKLCKYLFLSNTKRYGNRQNVFLANFAKFNSREVFEAGFFIFSHSLTLFYVSLTNSYSKITNKYQLKQKI